MSERNSGVTSGEKDEGATLVLAVKGHFDFSVHGGFRDAYRDAAGYRRYVVDLGETVYIDSSALGMLLLLREHAGNQGAEVVLRGPSPDVRNILEIANFHTLFTIED